MNIIEKTNHPLTIYVISDSVGETAQKALNAVLVQFPDTKKSREIKRFPFTTADILPDILKDALHDKAIVLTTLVDPKQVQIVHEFCRKSGLIHVDYMTPLIEAITQKTGQTPLQEAGASHKLDQSYFSRIEAIEFAVRYDDGKDARGFNQADLVLIGVSRTSKTPLSMYLANHKVKAANLPLIPGVQLPAELQNIPKEKIVALTASAQNLQSIRRSRLSSLGIEGDSRYADLDYIKKELSYANDVFNKLGVTPINVDHRAIEEVATEIEETHPLK